MAFRLLKNKLVNLETWKRLSLAIRHNYCVRPIMHKLHIFDSLKGGEWWG